MKYDELKSIIRIMCQSDVMEKTPDNLMLLSPPGSGKTEMIFSIAEDLGADMIVDHPALNDPTDIKGLPMAVDIDGQTHARFLPFGMPEAIMSAERLTIVFLDDFPHAVPAVQSSYMNLIQSRMINGVKIPDCIRFIAAGNERHHKAGANGLGTAIKSRFTIVQLEICHDAWCKWALQHGIPAWIVAFIKFRPDALSGGKLSMDADQQPCPRNVTQCGRWAAAGLPSSSYFEMFTGRCGEGWAKEAVSFFRVASELPDADAFIEDPEKFPVPEKLDVRYALCGALSAKATKKNSKKFFAAVERFPAEFCIMAVKDAIIRDKEIAQTKEFITFATVTHRDAFTGEND